MTKYGKIPEDLKYLYFHQIQLPTFESFQHSPLLQIDSSTTHLFFDLLSCPVMPQTKEEAEKPKGKISIRHCFKLYKLVLEEMYILPLCLEPTH